jgi:hypothetical protein
MGHCHWSSERVFEHYTKVDRVNRIKGSVLALKNSVVRDSSGECMADLPLPFTPLWTLGKVSHEPLICKFVFP